MSEEEFVPTKAEFLASLVSGNASYNSVGASVQRSHRFPLHIFMQIENLARMGNVPVSLIINQLLECGLDAVLHELPENLANEVSVVTGEQFARQTVTERVDVKPRKQSAKPKLTRAK